jgi:hypothetical protein
MTYLLAQFNGLKLNLICKSKKGGQTSLYLYKQLQLLQFRIVKA